MGVHGEESTALAAALGVALTDTTESRLFTSAEEELIRGLVSQLDTVLERGKKPRREAA